MALSVLPKDGAALLLVRKTEAVITVHNILKLLLKLTNAIFAGDILSLVLLDVLIEFYCSYL